MELNQLEVFTDKSPKMVEKRKCDYSVVNLEAEIPEALYQGMKEFIHSNPSWDQFQLMSSALAHFLFQNGCTDRNVTERYLNDLFNLAES